MGIGPPAPGQALRLLLHPLDVGDALGLHHGQGGAAQVVVVQAPQAGLHAVEPLAEDVAVDLAPEDLPGPGPVGLQQGANLGRGQVDDLREGNDGRPGAEGRLEAVRLGLQGGSGVRLPTGEGGHPRLGQDALRLPPALEGQEHIRTHQQPELVVREALPEGLHSVGGVALARPVQLDAVGLGQLVLSRLQAQPVGRQGGHGQPVPGGDRVGRQLLVGGLRGRDE